jgi:hypothetical protein
MREDGRKSNTSVFDDPIKPHERLLDKMMIRFTRKENGLGAIVQLQSQEWSDKKPITENLTTQSLTTKKGSPQDPKSEV